MASERATGPQRIAEAIEAYLRHRPQAADTLSGIARWWIGGDLQNPPREDLEEALHDLCRRGVLRVETQVSGDVIYRSGGIDGSKVEGES
jgi:hypothetical protein